MARCRLMANLLKTAGRFHPVANFSEVAQVRAMRYMRCYLLWRSTGHRFCDAHRQSAARLSNFELTEKIRNSGSARNFSDSSLGFQLEQATA